MRPETRALVRDLAAHTRAKPASYADDYAVHIDHLRIEADRWAAHDQALRLVLGARLVEEALTDQLATDVLTGEVDHG